MVYQFEIESVLSASLEVFRLQLVMARDFYQSYGSESDGALKLETWDNEIVLVQGQIFEPVTTIKEGQKNVRLRLSYDSDSRGLQVFNANGSLLVEAEDVHVPVQTELIVSIRNRGENLSC